MTANATTESEEDAIARAKINYAKAAFEENYQRILGYARYQHRRLRGEKRREAIAETLAEAWKIFRSQALTGDDPLENLSAIVRFAAGHVRAGKLRRHEERLPPMHSLSGEEGICDVRDKGAGPAEEVITQMDYKDWLAGLNTDHQEIVKDLVDGYDMPEIGQRRGCSRQAVFQSVERIRRDYSSRER